MGRKLKCLQCGGIRKGYKYCGPECRKKANAGQRPDWYKKLSKETKAGYAKRYYEKNKVMILHKEKLKKLQKTGRLGANGTYEGFIDDQGW